MKGRFINPVVIAAFFILMLVAGGFIFTGKDEQKTYENDAVEIEDYSPKIILPEMEVTKKPIFKIGEKFEYTVTGLKSNGETITFKDVFNVDDEKSINGSYYYVVNYKSTVTDDKNEEDKEESIITHIGYINKDNGSVISAIMLDYGEVILSEKETFEKWYFFMPWMLMLYDGSKWDIKIIEKQRIRDTSQLHERVFFTKTITTTYNFRVIGREKFKDKECFKVERIHKTGDEIDERVVMWVDAEKRILVKSEYWFENLKGMEIEMV